MGTTTPNRKHGARMKARETGHGVAASAVPLSARSPGAAGPICGGERAANIPRVTRAVGPGQRAPPAALAIEREVVDQEGTGR